MRREAAGTRLRARIRSEASWSGKQVDRIPCACGGTASPRRSFHESAGLTGIVLTKLDSTAKGGIVFAIERILGVPVRFVGVGEGLSDLVECDRARFVDALFA